MRTTRSSVVVEITRSSAGIARASSQSPRALIRHHLNASPGIVERRNERIHRACLFFARIDELRARQRSRARLAATARESIGSERSIEPARHHLNAARITELPRPANVAPRIVSFHDERSSIGVSALVGARCARLAAAQSAQPLQRSSSARHRAAGGERLRGVFASSAALARGNRPERRDDGTSRAWLVDLVQRADQRVERALRPLAAQRLGDALPRPTRTARSTSASSSASMLASSASVPAPPPPRSAPARRDREQAGSAASRRDARNPAS